MAAADMTITSVREEVVDFCVPYMNSGISILYKKPSRAMSNFMWLISWPFSYEYWFLLGIATLCVSRFYSKHLYSCDIFAKHLYSCDIFDRHLYSCDIFDRQMYSCDIFDRHLYSCDIFDRHLYSCDIFAKHLYSCDIFERH